MYIHGYPSSISWVSKTLGPILTCACVFFYTSLSLTRNQRREYLTHTSIFFQTYSFPPLFAAKNQRKTWVLVYFLATAATLIPAPLIEFRYYTIPFFFLILHSHVDDDRSWLLMGIMYLAINIFTIYLFLFRPFSWVHETGVQRFIW